MNNSEDFIIENGILKEYIGKGGDVVIPDGVTDIFMGAFASFVCCHYLTSVVIPDSVKVIWANAFYGCIHLEEVRMSNNLISIGFSAFQGCTRLKRIFIPNGVTGVGERAFEDCINLTIYVANRVKSLGWDAWWNYSKCPVNYLG